MGAQLGCLREFLVFKVVGMNELEHGVSEEEWILSVVKTPCHFCLGRMAPCRVPSVLYLVQWEVTVVQLYA